jgi:hypothetical protein
MKSISVLIILVGTQFAFGQLLKSHLFRGLAILLILTLGVPSTFAEQRAQQAEQAAVKIKATVAGIGVGEKSQVKVTLHDKRVVKGYVSELQDDAFVVRDKENGREQTVPYNAVAHIERGGNRIVEIAVGAGIVVGLLLVLLYRVADDS